MEPTLQEGEGLLDGTQRQPAQAKDPAVTATPPALAPQHHAVLVLQQQVGNRSVARRLQRLIPPPTTPPRPLTGGKEGDDDGPQSQTPSALSPTSAQNAPPTGLPPNSGGIGGGGGDGGGDGGGKTPPAGGPGPGGVGPPGGIGGGPPDTSIHRAPEALTGGDKLSSGKGFDPTSGKGPGTGATGAGSPPSTAKGLVGTGSPPSTAKGLVGTGGPAPTTAKGLVGAGPAPTTAKGLVGAGGPAPTTAKAGPTTTPAPGTPGAVHGAAPTGAGGLPDFKQFEAFWNANQSAINGARMGLEITRLIPGWGLIGGIAADALATVADIMAIPTEDAPITTTLIVTRDLLNLVNGAVGHLLYLDQLVQDGAAISVVGAPLVAITVPINEALAAVKVSFDGAILLLDTLVIFGAAYNASQAAPGSKAAEGWQGVVNNYVGNLMGDILTTILDSISLASGGAAQSEIANTGVRPVLNVLVKGGVFKNIVLPILQGAWNVWGGDAVGAAQNSRAGAAAEAAFYSQVIMGLNSIKLSYVVGDALMGIAADMFREKLGQMNAMATLLLGGQDPFRVIQTAGQQALANLRETLENTVSMQGMAASARAEVPGVRTYCEDAKAKVEAIAIPSLDFGRLESDGGVVDDIVTGVANAGISLVQEQLQGVVNSLNSTLDMAKSAVVSPIDQILGGLDEFLEFLQVVEDQAGVLVGMITPKIADLEAKLGRCNNATDLVNLIVNLILDAVGLDANFNVADAVAAWKSVGPMIDDAIVRATRAQRSATDRMMGRENAPGSGGAIAAPPATPPPVPVGGVGAATGGGGGPGGSGPAR